MKTKIFALLLVAVIAMLSLAACGDDSGTGNGGTGGGGENKHEHTFSESWTSTPTEHWHQATCEHGEIKDSRGDHVDVDEDGFCDVCEYEVGHTHSFASTWSYDESNHWRGATCSHKDQKKAVSLHTDINEDGKCDICTGHVHKKGEAGFCVIEGCGKQLEEIDNSNLTGIINAVINQSSLVNGVQIKSYASSKSAYGDSYNKTAEENVSVLFGKNGYINCYTEGKTTIGANPSSAIVTNYTYETWYEADGNDAFGVASENGATPSRVTIETEQLLGYSFNLSDLAGGYGTENFLYSIYEISQGEGVSDFTVEFGENLVSFSFNILSVHKIEGTEMIEDENGELVPGDKTTTYNVQYYEVAVSFTYNAQYVITSIDASLNIYKNNAGMIGDEPNLKDVNLKYYPETGKFDFVKYDQTYTSADGDNYRVVDKSVLTPIQYSYSVTQTVGSRTANNEHSKSSYIPTGFDLFTDEEHTEKVTGAINTTKGSFIYLYIDNCKPAGSSLDYVFEMIEYTILDSKGNPIENTDILGDGDTFKASFTLGSNQERYFMLYPIKAGNYTLVISLNGKIAHSVSIVVK